jgi:hypothetical protein
VMYVIFGYWYGEVVHFGSCSVMETGSNFENNGS